MNIKLNDVLLFVTGAALGSLVTWKLVENKYERYLDELFAEIDEDEDEYVFEESEPVEEESQEQEESHVLEEMREAYNNIAQEAGYLPKEVENMDAPHIISGEEFDTNTDYEKESLNYYADGALTDIGDDIIDFAEDLIGDVDLAEHFADESVDTVYVRNETTKCDYEILRDTRNYNDLED